MELNSGLVARWGGQRIGWNTVTNNNRTIITFFNVESWIPEVYELTYANDWYLAANLASDTGSTEFKLLSAPKAPKHPRPQGQGI